MRAAQNPRFSEQWERLQNSIGSVLRAAYDGNAADFKSEIDEAKIELDRLGRLADEPETNDAPVETPLGEAMGGE